MHGDLASGGQPAQSGIPGGPARVDGFERRFDDARRLVGRAVHDLNNLLTVVNGNSDLLLDTLKEGDPMRGPLSEIRQAGENAARLTQQLLALSDEQPIDLQQFDSNDLKARSILAAASPASILLVDDSRQVRAIYRKLLEDDGYQVREAGTPAEALSLLNAFPTDLVIADLNLDGQSGVALIAELRRTFPNVRTILMSAAFDSNGACGLALAGLADGILAKPADQAELRRAVAAALA